MTDTTTAEQITRVLERQLDALSRVLECLGEERDALLSRDLNQLAQVTERKNGSLAAVDSLEQQRRELAPSLSVMETLAKSPDVARRWEQLLDLTRKCREQNESNGRLIRRQRRRVESTLGLLRGEPASPKLYGPDGEQREKGRPRPPIASA